MRTVVRGMLAAGVVVCSWANWCLAVEAHTRVPAYAALDDDVYACAGAKSPVLSLRHAVVIRTREKSGEPPDVIDLPIADADLFPLRWTMDAERLYVIATGGSPGQPGVKITVVPLRSVNQIEEALRGQSGFGQKWLDWGTENTAGVEPVNHALRMRTFFGVDTVRYAFCPTDGRLFLLIRLADRISLWSTVPSWASSTRGRKLHWQRHCAFAAPFDEEFDTYAAASQIFLVNASRRVWRLNRSIKAIPAGPKFEDLIDVTYEDENIRGVRLRPVGEVFGAVDPQIRAEPVEQAEVGCVILDPARDAVFFTVNGSLAVAGKTSRFPLPVGWEPPSARAAEPDVKRIAELLPAIRAARQVLPTTNPAR
jgi:hypothetical protein